MGEKGLGSEGGGGRAAHSGRDEGGGSNDGKTSNKYARGLRESGSVGEAEVMLMRFRMRNGFRERLVTGSNERGYHGKKGAGRAYRQGKPEADISRPQDVGKQAVWERLHWAQRDQQAGRRG